MSRNWRVGIFIKYAKTLCDNERWRQCSVVLVLCPHVFSRGTLFAYYYYYRWEMLLLLLPARACRPRPTTNVRMAQQRTKQQQQQRRSRESTSTCTFLLVFRLMAAHIITLVISLILSWRGVALRMTKHLIPSFGLVLILQRRRIMVTLKRKLSVNRNTISAVSRFPLIVAVNRLHVTTMSRKMSETAFLYFERLGTGKTICWRIGASKARCRWGSQVHSRRCAMIQNSY